MAAFQRRHYVALAQVLRQVDHTPAETAVFRTIVDDLATMLENDNEGFNRERFYNAVFGDSA